MGATLQPEALPGRRFGLIADAHIHTGKTPPLPARLGEIFADVDGIIALGDMGEASGLDALAKIAPLSAITGEDDAHGDGRLAPLRLLSCGDIAIGALFDGAKSGLFTVNDPVAPRDNFEVALTRSFGRKPQVLLCAGTHKPYAASASGVFIVNPGSPTLADQRTVAILHIENSIVRAEHVAV